MKHSQWASWLLESVASLPNEGSGAPKQTLVRTFPSRLAKALRVLVLKVGFDPACKVRISGMPIPVLLPFSHQLPIYRSRHMHYDRLPGALAAYVRSRRGSLHMIDVGANVGDTILGTCPEPRDRYLALEPHPDFFPYLIGNMEAVAGVTCLQEACGESDGLLGFNRSRKGTAASVVVAASDHEVRVRPLDAIWDREWGRSKVDFLKVDTDGFDLSVLAGASGLLKEQQPWVLYECDVFLTEGGVQRHLDALRDLGCLGYSELICYDNLGHVLGKCRLSDSCVLRNLLELQKRQGPVRYQDILLVPPDESAEHFLFETSRREDFQSEKPFPLFHA